MVFAEQLSGRRNYTISLEGRIKAQPTLRASGGVGSSSVGSKMVAY